jgi:hypothetical protein
MSQPSQTPSSAFVPPPPEPASAEPTKSDWFVRQHAAGFCMIASLTALTLCVLPIAIDPPLPASLSFIPLASIPLACTNGIRNGRTLSLWFATVWALLVCVALFLPLAFGIQILINHHGTQITAFYLLLTAPVLAVTHGPLAYAGIRLLRNRRR